LTVPKKNIVQINVESNFGSTGKICENISAYLKENEFSSSIAHGPIHRDSESDTLQIGSKRDYYLHILNTRFFDKHGLGSISATKVFLKKLEEIKPDIIHLHNIHGYYINYELLFQFLNYAKSQSFGPYMTVGHLKDIVPIFNLLVVKNGIVLGQNAR